MNVYGGVEASINTFLFTAVDGVGGQLHALAALLPGKEPPVHTA
jgi:hypothetical protein